jgi:hypothetical protein
MTPTLGLADFLTYLFVAALLLAAGTGALLLLGAPFDRRTTILLGPITTQALWAVTLSLGLLSGLSVRRLAAPLLLGSVLLACVGLRRLWLRRDLHSLRDPLVAILVSCTLAPVLVLLPYFVFGLADYPGSRLPDGWLYVVMGRHLWTYGHRADGMLEPLYRYATFNVGSRDVASASLGMLSLLDHAGDTQRPVGLVMALALFTAGMSAAAVAVSRAWQVGRSVLFILLVVTSGWAANAVYANNYDNLLALGYLPAIAAVVRVFQLGSRGSWILLGLIAAGLTYTYPELVAPLLALGLVMVAERSWKAGSWRDARGIGLAAVVFLLLAGPHLPSTIRFLRSQAGSVFHPAGQSSLRPGEMLFKGLLIQKYRPSAFWGLGGEFLVPTLFRSQTAVAILLFMLLTVGIVRLLHSRDFGVLAALTLPLVAAPVLMFVDAYDYGAYKMILIGWWAVVLCLVEATASFRRPGVRWRVMTGLAVALCFAIPAVTLARSVTLALNARHATKVKGVLDHVSVAPRSMEQFRPLEEVQRIVGQQPVGIFVKDWEGLEWATYFLRDAHTRLGAFTGYLGTPEVRRKLESSSPYPWEGIRYILSDVEDPGPVVEAQSWTLVWRAGFFRLWDTGYQRQVVGHCHRCRESERCRACWRQAFHVAGRRDHTTPRHCAGPDVPGSHGNDGSRTASVSAGWANDPHSVGDGPTEYHHDDRWDQSFRRATSSWCERDRSHSSGPARQAHRKRRSAVLDRRSDRSQIESRGVLCSADRHRQQEWPGTTSWTFLLDGQRSDDAPSASVPVWRGQPCR